MSKVREHCGAHLAEFKNLLGSYIAAGSECEADMMINVDGEDPIGIWAGYKDEAKSQAWEKDTLTCVWSSSRYSRAWLRCSLLIAACSSRTLKWPNSGQISGKRPRRR